MMNDEQSSKDDEDFLDYEDDDPVMEDSYNLDEESEEEPLVAESNARSPLTDFKWRHYGTRSRVEESRRNQLKLSQDAFGKENLIFFNCYYQKDVYVIFLKWLSNFKKLILGF